MKKPKIPDNYVETYARQRRIKLIGKDDGLMLVTLLSGAGIKHKLRGNDFLSHVRIEGGEFVIDMRPAAAEQA